MASSLFLDWPASYSIIKISSRCQRSEAKKSDCIFPKVCIARTRSMQSYLSGTGSMKTETIVHGLFSQFSEKPDRSYKGRCSPGLGANRTSAVTNRLQLLSWGEVGDWGRRTISYPKRQQCSTSVQKARHLNVMFNHQIFKSWRLVQIFLKHGVWQVQQNTHVNGPFVPCGKAGNMCPAKFRKKRQQGKWSPLYTAGPTGRTWHEGQAET